MGPLIAIKTIPFTYELRISDAKFETKNNFPNHHTMSRETGGLEISHTPPRLHIDSTEARASMGLKTVKRVVSETAQKGISAAQKATGQIAKEGDIMMDTRNKDAVASIGLQRSQTSIDTMLGFIPSTPAKVSFDPHQLSMQYEMDKLSFDWRNSNTSKADFVPASVEFHVKEYARLEIEYLGGPLYIPKSADPNYVEPNIPAPLDVKA